MRIYSQSGYLQYKKESLIYSDVSHAQLFGKVLIKRDNEVNGIVNTTFQFTLNLSRPVYKGEYFKITPPSPAVVINSAKDQCRG